MYLFSFYPQASNIAEMHCLVPTIVNTYAHVLFVHSHILSANQKIFYKVLYWSFTLKSVMYIEFWPVLGWCILCIKIVDCNLMMWKSVLFIPNTAAIGLLYFSVFIYSCV
jgi:hypothetical protein